MFFIFTLFYFSWALYTAIYFVSLGSFIENDRIYMALVLLTLVPIETLIALLYALYALQQTLLLIP